MNQDVIESMDGDAPRDGVDPRHLRLVSESMGDVASVHDAVTNILFISPSCERIFGQPPGAFLGMRLESSAHREDAQALQAALEAGVRGKPGRVEWRFGRSDGEFVWQESEISPARGEGGGRVVCRTRDIIRRKERESQIRQAQKLEAVGRLAAGIAHDFNNLLTVVNGFGEILRDSLPEDSPEWDLANEIVLAGERGATLTRQLLAFGRRQPRSAELLDLNSALVRKRPLVERIVGEDVELYLELDPSVATVLLDHARLEQVVMNLVLNARDAIQGGGRVVIRTANIDCLEERASDRSGAPIGNYVSLSVSDTGCGMDPLTLARLFEPFFSTKEEGKGSGLGLATVYGVVRQSDGHIDVESREGEGTTVRILFPRPTGDSSPTVPDFPAPAGGSASILLVEDDPGVRAFTRKLLVDAGYAVTAACNGMEAVEAFNARGKPFDLVLTDVVMPKLGGWALVERLREQSPELRIAIMSGYTGNPSVLEAIQRSGLPFIPKPFTPAAILSAVRAALAGIPD